MSSSNDATSKVVVLREKSFTCGFTLPSDLAAKIRKDNAERAARRTADGNSQRVQVPANVTLEPLSVKPVTAVAVVQDPEPVVSTASDSVTELADQVNTVTEAEEKHDALTAAAPVDREPRLRDQDEPVLILDASTIMGDGADLSDGELEEFRQGMIQSFDKNCDYSCERLFDEFSEQGACFYSALGESSNVCRQLRKRFPDRQFFTVPFPHTYLESNDWQILYKETRKESQSLELLRLALQNCLRPLSWKVAMFEELQKLALNSEPGRRRKEALARERARGWDEDEFNDDAFADMSIKSSIANFVEKRERQADTLDMVLAMILQRQPPRQHRESETEKYTELAELHSEVREKWLREHGDPPNDLE